MLTVGSCFSGIGGIELGLERTGYFKTIWQVENDKYATAILERHWPDARRYGDIRRLRRPEYVDLICGGFPCQDISNAGKRSGIHGKRSGLWKEMFRIIRTVRPRYVLVENVSALLVRGIDQVLGDLASIGYDAEWNCITASSVGAPHRRNRIFIVGYPVGIGCNRLDGREARPQPSDGCKDVPDSDCIRWDKQIPNQKPFKDGQAMGHTFSERQQMQFNIFPENQAWPGTECSDWWAAEPDVGRVAHGVPFRVDRLKCLGNAVVPQVAEQIGEMIKEFDQKCR